MIHSHDVDYPRSDKIWHSHGDNTANIHDLYQKAFVKIGVMNTQEAFIMFCNTSFWIPYVFDVGISQAVFHKATSVSESNYKSVSC